MKKAFIKVAVATVCLMGAMGLSGCGILYNVYENMTSGGSGSNTNIYDEPVTGAWKEGSFWCGDYIVELVCPEAGHPSGSADSDWSTGCELEDGTNVNVDFYAREGSLADRITEAEDAGMTVSEGMLWENPCYFYEDDVELITIALIEVDEGNYVEISFESWDEEVVPFDEIPDAFTMEVRLR
ncbi:MAG: hypothetical protein IJ336_08480 [Lachnospiraceae bacterium]|nr:hypothetical protein [Lachnospiraceae bacterium]